MTRKVAIITGGGYGHLPLFWGYVGRGLCDGCAVGNIFSLPSFESIWALTKHLRSSQGVLYLFGNYFNDSISFLNAAEMADLEGILNATVKISDDITSAAARHERRGNAGCFFAYKITGACAEERNSLQCVRKTAKKAISRISTCGIMTAAGHIPSSSEPLFKIHENEFIMGAGLHGEKDGKTLTAVSSRELVALIAPELMEDQQITGGDSVAVLVNGLGGTASEDLYVVYNDLADYLHDKGVQISHSYVGEYATSMDSSGLSITIMKLDEEMEHYLSAPAQSPLFSFL